MRCSVPLALTLFLHCALPSNRAIAQSQDAWNKPECFSGMKGHRLLTMEAQSDDLMEPSITTIKILENYRGDIMVNWYNPLEPSMTKTQIVHTPYELESTVKTILLSKLDGKTGMTWKNSFSFNRNKQTIRPCSVIITSLINALQSARDVKAEQKSGMSESQLQEAFAAVESPSMKLAYRKALDEVDQELPAWIWVERTPPPPPPRGTTTIEIVDDRDMEIVEIMGEEIVEEEEGSEEEIPFMIVEDMPGFGPCKIMSGQERDQCTQLEIIKYISNNMKYPPIAKDAGIQGTVFVYFVVGRNGTVKDTRVLRPVDPRLDAEALRVVSSLPDFEPGRQQGKPVSVQYTIPVKFIFR